MSVSRYIVKGGCLYLEHYETVHAKVFHFYSNQIIDAEMVSVSLLLETLSRPEQMVIKFIPMHSASFYKN